jgi:hypothetical protein
MRLAGMNEAHYLSPMSEFVGELEAGVAQPRPRLGVDKRFLIARESSVWLAQVNSVGQVK